MSFGCAIGRWRGRLRLSIRQRSIPGILRMADLLALQPNMDIRLHIVAPDEKREKVLREIRRPVFSLLDRGPLYENCSFLGYSDIQDIGGMKHLSHMSDSIVEEYEEFAHEV